MDVNNRPISKSAEGRLVEADSFTQFGDGYRQIVGAKTIANGPVSDLLAHAAHLSTAGKHLFISVEGGVFSTPAEVEDNLVD